MPRRPTSHYNNTDDTHMKNKISFAVLLGGGVLLAAGAAVTLVLVLVNVLSTDNEVQAAFAASRASASAAEAADTALTFDEDFDPWSLMLTLDYTEKEGRFYPSFSEELYNLDGRRVRIRGFMYPFSNNLLHRQFALSALPIASCFFCGGSGPETVVDVLMHPDHDGIEYLYKMIELEGTLRLNGSNPDAFFYYLEDAKLVSAEPNDANAAPPVHTQQTESN